MNKNNVVVEAKNLHKSFFVGSDKPPLEVLKDASLVIQEKTVTSIVGSSGSGKSTLLHILGGLDSADSGEVFWSGTNISSMSTDKLSDFRNKYIGFVFQFHHLLPEFTALENISMPALIGGMKQAEAYERARELLNRFGIENREDHRPAQLSGGEQQRVSMARALMNSPRVILADEPTGNLDEKNSNIILDMLLELRDTDGVSVLLITHEKDIARRSDTILELKNGILNQL